MNLITYNSEKRYLESPHVLRATSAGGQFPFKTENDIGEESVPPTDLAPEKSDKKDNPPVKGESDFSSWMI